ncbi:hypothetical protein MVES_000964 [Malassezia vespertilionis]|uniref:Inositol hexakisphosphate and diphosphoinositol-pentakisphosphate kinase n=2 Tax=Malassezia vespertilionis TaxID=2020962 RepID=A0A2N1JFB7_9BASI|nr:hypothetical protein MVES_000964 [Malassezia vespertilionis]
MDRKARSKPMQNILNRLLLKDNVEVINFGDKMILDEDVEMWPIVDVLISFFSTGFPLEKAIRYVHLRKPVCVNDLDLQTVLWDRRAVLRILAASGVPTPPSLSVDRNGGPDLDPALVQDIKNRLGVDISVAHVPKQFEMHDEDVLVVNGQSIRKPFVEKPVSGEDHNVHIYFPKSRGGGGRRLFRKVGNKSSEFDPNLVYPRTDGSYIYEEFMDVDNAEDIKIYTIGPDFAHAETRKSPVVDGLVKRNPDGKEVRYITELTADERRIAREISLAFKQFICGFDLLRVKDKSYVIDVNGWSFVKGNDEYYDKCAQVLSKFFEANVASCPQRSPCVLENVSEETSSWVLKANVTVFRHGDRSPKQKLKRSFKASEPFAAPVIALLHGCREEIILRQQLELVEEALEEASKLPDANEEDLLFLIEVIERKKDMPGTKIQIKPSFNKETGVLEKTQLIIKWGGEFSHAARHQARDYGKNMRRDMLIMNKEALDNCTVYTSSERRVLSSAEIFANAFLNDEKQDDSTDNKPREMVVRKDLLDDSNAAKDLLDRVKKELKKDLAPGSPTQNERPVGWPEDLPPPALMGGTIREILLSLGETMHKNYETLDVDTVQDRWCTHETPMLFRERWDKLIHDFDEEPHEPTRASELSDMLSHDGLHNRAFLERIFYSPDEEPRLNRLHKLYRLSLVLFDYVCPREYGITSEEKEQIGLLTSQPLLKSIIGNLKKSSEVKGLCAFYFTKESHIHTLLNLILSSDLKVIMPRPPPMDYFSSITFEVYERETSHSNSASPTDTLASNAGKPELSLVISVSEGAHSNEVLFINLDARHALTPLPSRKLTTHMDFDEAIAKLSTHSCKRQDNETARGQVEGSAVFFGEQDEDQRIVPIPYKCMDIDGYSVTSTIPASLPSFQVAMRQGLFKARSNTNQINASMVPSMRLMSSTPRRLDDSRDKERKTTGAEIPAKKAEEAPKTMQERMQSMWSTIKYLFRFYLNGVKQIWSNRTIVKEIRAEVRETGRPLTFEETTMIRTHGSDMIKLPLFLLILVTLEELLPLMVIYTPFLLPSTCILPSQRLKIRKRLEVKRENAVKEVNHLNLDDPVLQQANSGEGMEQSKSLSSISPQGIQELVTIFNLSAWGGNRLRRGRLAAHIKRLLDDDKSLALSRLLSETSDDNLDLLADTCTERGIRAVNVTAAEMRETKPPSLLQVALLPKQLPEIGGPEEVILEEIKQEDDQTVMRQTSTVVSEVVQEEKRIESEEKRK